MDFEHDVTGIFNTGTSIKGWISEMGSIEVKFQRNTRKLIP